jgi:hypothetical protein
LNQVQNYEILNTGFTLPTPVSVDSSMVHVDEQAQAYEAVFVRIDGVNVVEVNPEAGAGDLNPNREFILDGGLRVNDFIFRYTLPMVGDQWDSIQGIMRLGNTFYKLEPRSIEDYGRSIPMGDPSFLVINEIDYSEPGADQKEFIEIYNAGSQPAPLLDIVLELVNGTDGNPIYSTINLSDQFDVLEAGSFLVVGNQALLAELSADTLSIQIGNSSIQNGPDGVRLSHPTLGILDELAYGGLSLSEGGVDIDEEGIDASIGRCGDDLDQNESDFVLMTRTPGTENQCN